jgi:AcrR family transcriptional regulator
VARTLDTRVDDAIARATLKLLTQHGFARLTVEGIAKTAGVGKPAIYRRFGDKTAVVTHLICTHLPELELPDLSDARAELWLAVERGLPADGPSYVGLIGGLIAEQDRHPELIDSFRRHVLLPRRAVVRVVIERGQARRQIRSDLDPDEAIDLMAGPFLARVFAGLDTGPDWRLAAFATWWEFLRNRSADD